MENYNEIRLVDDSDYIPGLGNNGGHYSFATVFKMVSENNFIVYETTSGEFCPYCNRWDCCGNCHILEYITAAEIAAEIKKFRNYGKDYEHCLGDLYIEYTDLYGKKSYEYV